MKIMEPGIDLRRYILDTYCVKGDVKSLEFCRKAYDFVMGNDKADTPSTETNTDPIAVDLGLPSGTKWADRNVGAKLPEDTGLYFSWGNTDGNEAGKDYDFYDDTYDDTPGAELDGDIDLAHDAARANLGEPWQMPTKDQFKELVDNCECEVCTLNGYLGRRFTSKINGNSIFMPFAGYIYGTGLHDRGSYGYYWSASLHSSANGFHLYFFSGGVVPAYNYNRFSGFSVRAVQNIA
jgi:hypothetical protein